MKYGATKPSRLWRCTIIIDFRMQKTLNIFGYFGKKYTSTESNDVLIRFFGAVFIAHYSTIHVPSICWSQYKSIKFAKFAESFIRSLSLAFVCNLVVFEVFVLYRREKFAAQCIAYVYSRPVLCGNEFLLLQMDERSFSGQGVGLED